MEVGATASVYVDCASYEPEFECHTTIEKEFSLLFGEIGPNAIHEWLEENEWLWLGDRGYCPVCRKQLYD